MEIFREVTTRIIVPLSELKKMQAQQLAALLKLALLGDIDSTYAIDAFCNCLTQCIMLEELVLSRKQLSSDLIKALIKTLKERLSGPNIRNLSLEFCHIDDDAALLIGELFSNLQLKVLNLENINLGYNTAQALCYLLDPKIAQQFNNFIDLQIFKISNVPIDPDDKPPVHPQSLASLLKDEAMTQLDSLPENNTLINLNLNNNNLNPSHLRLLLAVLKKLTALRTLHLNENYFTSIGMWFLAPTLVNFKHLVELYLNNNAIGPNGAQYLAEYLSNLKNLQYLDIANNSIGHEGAKHLAPPLAALTQLTHLNLSGNNLQLAGIKILTPALANMIMLTHLNISANDLSRKAINNLFSAILKTMRSNLCELLEDNIESNLNEMLKLLAKNSQRKATILALVVSCKRRQLPHMPTEIYHLVHDDFVPYATYSNNSKK